MKHRGRILTNNLTNRLHGKQHASFVVSQHYGNNSGVRAQNLSQLVEIKVAMAIDFQPRNFASDLSQMLTEVSHRFMLHARSDDVALCRVLLQKSTNGPVVRLRTARGEDDFIIVRPD